MPSRIKILSEPAPVVATEPMPLEQSLRWVSPHQDQVDARVEIFFNQSALSGCMEHTISDVENEVGGLLIGQVRVDPLHARPYILIEDIIPALHTQSGQTHVTFTQDSLVQLHGELESRFPNKRIVGWYHTHPRLGVFLSSYDTWIHKHFFTDPTQVALVVDPYYERGGFFCWQINRQLNPIHYVGFHEIGDIGEDSVVVWNNLEPAAQMEEGEKS